MNLTKSMFELQDLLLLIGVESRTGELVIESGNNIGSLLFHEGKILLAFSPYTRALGDLLVERGMLKESELLDVLQQQRSGSSAPIGQLLLQAGKIGFPMIEAMVQDQIRSAITDFARWKPVEFTFIKKSVEPVDSIHLPVYEFLGPELQQAVREFSARMARGAASPLGQGA